MEGAASCCGLSIPCAVVLSQIARLPLQLPLQLPLPYHHHYHYHATTTTTTTATTTTNTTIPTRDQTVLKGVLPPKFEWILHCKNSKLQVDCSHTCVRSDSLNIIGFGPGPQQNLCRSFGVCSIRVRRFLFHAPVRAGFCRVSYIVRSFVRAGEATGRCIG